MPALVSSFVFGEALILGAEAATSTVNPNATGVRFIVVGACEIETTKPKGPAVQNGLVMAPHPNFRVSITCSVGTPHKIEMDARTEANISISKHKKPAIDSPGRPSRAIYRLNQSWKTHPTGTGNDPVSITIVY